MVTDALLDFGVWFLELLVATLPDMGSLSLPDMSAVYGHLADINALVPVVGPMKMAVGILTLVMAFGVFRAIEWAWKMLPLT